MFGEDKKKKKKQMMMADDVVCRAATRSRRELFETNCTTIIIYRFHCITRTFGPHDMQLSRHSEIALFEHSRKLTKNASKSEL